MSSRKPHSEPESEPVRRSFKFDPEILNQVGKFVKNHRSAVDPWTKARVFDEALRDFFDKHGWSQPNGTAAQKKKTLHAAS